jgi:ribosomal protein S18 acetylase RimI-like enzyme
MVAAGRGARHTAAMAPPAFRIAPVRDAADLDATVALFRAYAAALPIDLAYQGFEAELAALPGPYAAPTGELLLARNDSGAAVGCVGLRRLGPSGVCEMKRLYVDPAARGAGLGEALVAAIIAAAERLGYREMRLDTLPSMAGALALYRRAGFAPTAPYYDTPVAGTLFMRRDLAPGS